MQATRAVEAHGHGTQQLVAVPDGADDVAVLVAAGELLTGHRETPVAITALNKAKGVTFEGSKVAVQLQWRATEWIERHGAAF
ncbi:hypothetical protein DBR42_17110 [Pelomonas sp. HMWF004]|nr:hypothetical protein DBR42_17110 [Pelomonas sp. HMWF004]